MTIVCPHCNYQVIEEGICASCKKICPANPERSHYQVLGYKDVKLELDPEDLERRFFCLSRIFHPDRYAGKSATEQQFAHDHSAAINSAYRTLRDPFSRAKYVVDHELGNSDHNGKHVPAELAEMIFEVQDLLQTITETSTQSKELLDQAQSTENGLVDRVEGVESRIQELFSQYDASRHDSVLEQIRALLYERTYLKSLLRQMEAAVSEKGWTAGI